MSLDVDNAAGALFDGEVEDYAITVADGVNVSGRVFVDANSNGSNDATKSGIVKHTVVLYDSLFDTCRSTYTNSNGDYRFSAVPDGGYEVYQAAGETVPVPQNCDPTLAKNPPNYTSTTPDSLTLLVAGTDVVNQNFGESQGPVFEPDHQSEVLPGNVVFYAHTFSSPVAGTVRFTTAHDLAESAGWNHLLYRDSNCDGVLNGAEASTPIAGMNLGINSDARLCLINKVYAPSNAALGDQYRVITTADFSYAGGSASPASLIVTDLTKAGQKVSPTTASTVEVGESRLKLRKTVENISQGTAETAALNQAKPGEFLTYRIYYQNTGTGPITDLKVNDVIPDYSGYISGSAKCESTPNGLSCTPPISDTNIAWEFTGALAGGSSGSVSYEVVIDQ